MNQDIEILDDTRDKLREVLSEYLKGNVSSEVSQTATYNANGITRAIATKHLVLRK